MKNFNQWLESLDKVLYIVRGVSGSGKSTLSRSLASVENIFSTDDFFILGGEYRFDSSKLGFFHKKNQDRVKEAMMAGVFPIVVDNTNTMRWEMKPYVLLADEYGYRVEIRESLVPWRHDPVELAKRNLHGVPEVVIRSMLDRYEKDIGVDDIRGI